MENLDRELPREKNESGNDQLKAVGVTESLQGNKKNMQKVSESEECSAELSLENSEHDKFHLEIQELQQTLK